MEKKKLSLTFRFLRAIGLNFSEEEYGQVSLFGALGRAFRGLKNALLLKYCMYSVLLSPINYRKIRPVLWRWIGAKVGKGCYIGYEVYLDISHADMVTIEDNVTVTNRCFFLCHQRDLSDYYVGDDSTKLGYNVEPITLKKGCMIGSETIIMPGVTVGEGAIVGAGSLINKDIPAWTVATGRPARVVRKIPKKEGDDLQNC